jgi:hypothetical protein
MVKFSDTDKYWTHMKWWQSPRKEVDLMLYRLACIFERTDRVDKLKYEREFGSERI